MTDETDRTRDSSAAGAQILGHVVLIGAGLIGASIGQALGRAGVPVEIRDANPSHAWVAASRGAGSLRELPADQVNLVVVAVPPRAIAEVVAEALGHYPNATVTDVGSVKAPQLIDLAGHAGLERYVGSHPMAGSHIAGPLAASPDLFVDRTWAITPHPESSTAAVGLIKNLAVTCGAQPLIMSPAQHDQAVGRVSHLPHLLAATLAGQLRDLPPEELALAGQGLRDVTRIAAGDPGLWEQIIAANSTTLIPELEALRDRLGHLVATLSQPDPDLRSALNDGVAGVRRLPGKHGSAPVEYASVIVQIPDEPGSLARLFGDVDQAGVNVEDVRIEHDPARLIGHLRLFIDPARAPTLTAAMTESGWTVRPGSSAAAL